LIEKTGSLINWKFTHRAKVSSHRIGSSLFEPGETLPQ